MGACSLWVRPAIAFVLAAALICGSAAPPAAAVRPRAAANPTVIDVNRSGGDSIVRNLTAFQGKIYMLRLNDGIDLWRSDGTAEGTELVMTLAQGATTSVSGLWMAVAAGRLLILIDDDQRGSALWVSDGTAAGTSRLLALSRACPACSRTVGAAVDRLFFANYDAEGGAELWVSDGTAQGTGRLRDINPGSAGSSPAAITAAGNRLYFLANDGSHGTTLWLSDGTADGTRLVDAAAPGTVPQGLYGLTAVGDRLYFAVGGEAAELELWRTGGSAATTERVQSWPVTWSFSEGVAVGGRLAFVLRRACGGIAGCQPIAYELWYSDGTADGTHQFIAMAALRQLTVVGALLFFVAEDGIHSSDLWMSDGTPVGTGPVRDTATAVPWSAPREMVAVGYTLFFIVDSYRSDTRQWESGLWASDGRAVGTRLIYSYQEFPTAPAATHAPYGVTRLGDMLLFVAWEQGSGYELWRSDGTADGTRLVKDLTLTTLSSSPFDLMALGDRVVFIASDGRSGAEPWVSDGTPAGTRQLADVAPGPGSLEFHGFVRLGDRAFVVASRGFFSIAERTRRSGFADGRRPAARGMGGSYVGEVWRTDGTPQGTALLLDDLLAVNTSLAVSGGRLFFCGGLDGADQLWVSDGTAAGTAPVAAAPADACQHYNERLIAVGDRLFFAAADRLWASDGTAAGTVQISDAAIDRFLFVTGSFAVLGPRLFFLNRDAAGDTELWVSDGTAAGTRAVRQARPGLAPIAPRMLTVVDDQIFFVETLGCDLWKSDGSSAGTQLVRAFDGNAQACFLSLSQSAGRAFLFAPDAASGVELWASDGTPAGTRLVKDIWPGPQGCNPWGMTSSAGLILFAASDGASGYELWRSDGTPEGTQMLNLQPDPLGSSPSGMTVVGDRLFFNAADTRYGYELWSLPLSDLGLEIQRVYLPQMSW